MNDELIIKGVDREMVLNASAILYAGILRGWAAYSSMSEYLSDEEKDAEMTKIKDTLRFNQALINYLKQTEEEES